MYEDKLRIALDNRSNDKVMELVKDAITIRLHLLGEHLQREFPKLLNGTDSEQSDYASRALDQLISNDQVDHSFANYIAGEAAKETFGTRLWQKVKYWGIRLGVIIAIFVAEWAIDYFQQLLA